jgi:hypothetical protein
MLLPIRHTHWMTGVIGLSLGMSLLSAGAGRAATVATPTSQQLSHTLELASRVQLRLGSRPVRYRLGAFRRGASCLQDEAELVPLIPDVTETEAEAGNLPPELSVPVDATTLSHPAFFVYVPPLEAETTAQFTLQTDPDNLSAVEELVSVRFPITAEGGVIGIYLPESSPGLAEEQQYYWQMAVECDTEELTENPVVSGWVRRVASADLPSPPSTVVSAVLFYAEQGIWQNALTILATERYNNPGDLALSQTWTDLLTAAGLETLAEAPLAQQINLTVPATEGETSTESSTP